MARKSNTPTIVTPATVRAAFRDGTLDVADVKDDKGNPVNPASVLGGKTAGIVRGRLNPAFARAYEAANPGTEVREKVANERTIEVPMFSPKTGRPVKAKVVSLSEVRKAAGIEGKKGRISQADLLKAAVAFGSGQPKA